MLFSNTTFIGIDPTAGQRPFAYAAIDSDLHLLALGDCYLDDVLAFVAGQRQAFVAVCAPRRPNQGVMERPEVRAGLSPAPRPGRWIHFRLAEYQLRQHHISCPPTPPHEKECPNWMQVGFTLFRRLEGLGYQTYPTSGASLQFLEVYPFASFCALLGLVPFPKHSLEGRIQRQLVLYEQNLRIPDPMRFFEEITRHRLLQGILPIEDLYKPSELDALIAAYTAWMAATHPGQTSLLGDESEGQVVIPVAELKRRY
ncbi:MAG: DUF429 domain-containing protein [Chloroflexota bacterium]|nr:MAG: DUF429 domain-containing protein [Chloroflexota bacterium]